jgi:hypothetical protein
MAEEGHAYKVQHELVEDEVHRTVVSDLFYRGSVPYAILPPDGTQDKASPRQSVALDPTLLQEFVIGGATHLYSAPVRRPRKGRNEP